MPSNLTIDHPSRPLVLDKNDTSLPRHTPGYPPSFFVESAWANLTANGARALINQVQFPRRSKCNTSTRMLLIEVDLQNAGLGFTSRILTHALLLAMDMGRSLVEVPVDGGWAHKPAGGVGAARNVSAARSPHWCTQPPFTFGCFYEPWSSCPIPSAEEVRSAYAPPVGEFTPAQWRVHRLLKMKLTNVGGWMGRQTAPALEQAAVALLWGRPRLWVQRLGVACLEQLGQIGPSAPRATPFLAPPAAPDAAAAAHAAEPTRPFATIHIRDSPQKRREQSGVESRLPPAEAYAALARALARALQTDRVLVQTAHPKRLAQFVQHAAAHDGAQPGALEVTFTANPRSADDAWAGWAMVRAAAAPASTPPSTPASTPGSTPPSTPPSTLPSTPGSTQASTTGGAAASPARPNRTLATVEWHKTADGHAQTADGRSELSSPPRTPPPPDTAAAITMQTAVAAVNLHVAEWSEALVSLANSMWTPLLQHACGRQFAHPSPMASPSVVSALVHIGSVDGRSSGKFAGLLLMIRGAAAAGENGSAHARFRRLREVLRCDRGTRIAHAITSFHCRLELGRDASSSPCMPVAKLGMSVAKLGMPVAAHQAARNATRSTPSPQAAQVDHSSWCRLTLHVPSASANHSTV